MTSKNITFKPEKREIMKDYITICPSCKRNNLVMRPGCYQIIREERRELQPTIFKCEGCGAKFKIELIFHEYYDLSGIDVKFECSIE